MHACVCFHVIPRETGVCVCVDIKVFLVLFERLGLVSRVKALKMPCGRCEGQPGI